MVGEPLFDVDRETPAVEARAQTTQQPDAPIATPSAEEIACLNEQIEFGRKLSRQLLADDPEALPPRRRAPPSDMDFRFHGGMVGG
jgi:hypothetical protein